MNCTILGNVLQVTTTGVLVVLASVVILFVRDVRRDMKGRR